MAINGSMASCCQDDPDVVLAALTSCGRALQYASQRLRADRDFVFISQDHTNNKLVTEIRRDIMFFRTHFTQGRGHTDFQNLIFQISLAVSKALVQSRLGSHASLRKQVLYVGLRFLPRLTHAPTHTHTRKKNKFSAWVEPLSGCSLLHKTLSKLPIPRAIAPKALGHGPCCNYVIKWHYVDGAFLGETS